MTIQNILTVSIALVLSFSCVQTVSAQFDSDKSADTPRLVPVKKESKPAISFPSIPKFKVPEFKKPEFMKSDFSLPEFKMPEFKPPAFNLPKPKPGGFVDTVTTGTRNVVTRSKETLMPWTKPKTDMSFLGMREKKKTFFEKLFEQKPESSAPRTASEWLKQNKRIR